MAAHTGWVARRHAQRLLREVLIHGGQRHGFALCHAAVIAWAGRGLLIGGDSGTGKTDLAVKVARVLGADVVSIDRSLVERRDEHLAASCLPFGLNIHIGTLTDLGCPIELIRRLYPASHDKHYLNVHDARRLCRLSLRAQAGIVGCVKLTQPAVGEPEHGSPVTSEHLGEILAAIVTVGIDPGFTVDWLGLGVQRFRPAPGEWASHLPAGGMIVRYVPGSGRMVQRIAEWAATALTPATRVPPAEKPPT